MADETVKAVLFDPSGKPNVRACFSLVDVPRQQELGDSQMRALQKLVGGSFDLLVVKGYEAYFNDCAAIDDNGYDGSWWKFLHGPHDQTLWPFPPAGQCLLGPVVFVKRGGRSCTDQDIRVLDGLCTCVQHDHKPSAEQWAIEGNRSGNITILR